MGKQGGSNYDIVKHNLGTTTADAIRGMVRDEMSGFREEVAGLVSRQAKNIEAAEAEGSPKAAKVADGGTVAVQAADQAVKEAVADPTPEKAAEAKEAVEVAKDKVEEAESDLAARVSAVEKTFAPWREEEKLGSRKPSRFDPLEQDMARLSGQIDQAEARYSEATDMVRANRGPALWIVALVAFAAAFIITSVMAVFTPLTIFWDAVWLAIATTAFVTIVTWVLEDVVPKVGASQKRSEVPKASQTNAKLSIMQGASER